MYYLTSAAQLDEFVYLDYDELTLTDMNRGVPLVYYFEKRAKNSTSGQDYEEELAPDYLNWEEIQPRALYLCLFNSPELPPDPTWYNVIPRKVMEELRPKWIRPRSEFVTIGRLSLPEGCEVLIHRAEIFGHEK